jgi:hypothetical protein
MRLLLTGFVAWSLHAQSPSSAPFGDFQQRVAQYIKIRRTAEAEAGRPSPTPSPEKLDGKKKALAETIVSKRPGAKQGDLFTPEIAAELRRVIATDFERHPAKIKESLHSAESVSGRVHVNELYPEHVAIATMPSTLLMSLPKLPRELDYRFVGSTLILRDIDANLILDFMPNALPPN